MRPRRDRWLSLLEVAELLDEHVPRLSMLSRKRRREHVLRLVRRVEKRDGEPLSKRVGREWFVSRNGIDALQKWEPEALTELQRSVSDLHEKHKGLQRQVNGHGSKLRELAEKQRLADNYLSGMARLEAASSPQNRRTG